MSSNPYYQRHFQYLLGRTPELAVLWVERTRAALRESSADLALAQDRNLLFQVSEVVMNHQAKLEASWAFHAQTEIESAGQATRGLSIDQVRMDELTLVDEAEAEKEIEISRTVQLIDLTAEWEWRELQAFSATLLQEKKLRAEANPFRPAVYARAMSQATQALPLSPPERALLLRVGGRVLANLLREVYAQACDRLRGEGLAPMAYQAAAEPAKPRSSGVNVTQPGALQNLLHRIPPSRLMDHGMPAPMVSASLDQAFARLAVQQAPTAPASAPGLTRAQPTTAAAQAGTADPASVALLSRLFEQMVKDHALQPAIKDLIGQIEPGVLRVAMQDNKILRTDQHPTWRLLNEVASYANGYTESTDSELGAFVNFLKPLIHKLAQTPQPRAEQYEEALNQVQGFIEQQSQAQVQPTQATVAKLEQADHKQTLRPILQQQVAHQLAATKVSDRVKYFLNHTWVDVLAHVMTEQGHDSDEAQAMLSTVDDLIGSLQRPTNTQERDALRQSLPSLIQRLQRGMAAIELPPADRDAILDELMVTHTRYLRTAPKPKREATPQELVAQLQEEMQEALSEEGPQSGDAPFEHKLGKHALDTNVGSLPTVPMAFGQAAESGRTDPAVSEWINSLHKGSWCKLFMQGHWISAHLVWFSGNRQFFMFTSDHAGRMHSMTLRALERLRSEGLATSLEDRSLMQRAVDSLLQDLDE